MTVREAMKKYNKKEWETRVYVQELDDEAREIYPYLDSEVIRIYPHNGDMTCEVKEVK